MSNLDRQYARDAAAGDGHASPIEKALNNALDAWAEWSRLGVLASGLPDHSPMFRGAYGSPDWEQWCDDQDHETAMSVQAAVWDLPSLERRAVIVTKLGGKWPDTAPPLLEVYLRAKAELLVVLVRRNVITE